MLNIFRGRFAPSPSGEMHMGNAWTALLAWLQIRSLAGTMVLRIEDLDPDRSKHAFIQQLMLDLKWLGLDWDEGPDVGGPFAPYCQGKRRDLYENALRKLANTGLLYACYCSRAELRSAAQAPHGGENVYPGTCRSRGKEIKGQQAALRLDVPSRTIEFNDLCKGSYVQDMALEAGDFIVRRADGVHAYQLAVVVDDAAMNITHVLRGADLLDSTPRQLLLYELLGLPKPQFSHVPLLIGSDGQRLAKRHGDISIAALRRMGVKSEQIIGFLAYKANLINTCLPLKPHDLIDKFALAKIPQEKVIISTPDLSSLIK